MAYPILIQNRTWSWTYWSVILTSSQHFTAVPVSKCAEDATDVNKQTVFFHSLFFSLYFCPPPPSLPEQRYRKITSSTSLLIVIIDKHRMERLGWLWQLPMWTQRPAGCSFFSNTAVTCFSCALCAPVIGNCKTSLLCPKNKMMKMYCLPPQVYP